MKKIGSVAEFGPQRDRELLAAFKAQLHNLGHLPLKEMFRRAAETKTSRFWVSERRAAIVISSMLKGDRLEYMSPKRREMYYEIFKIFKKIRLRSPEMTIYDAAYEAVNSEAPEFYLTPKSAKVLIYRARRG